VPSFSEASFISTARASAAAARTAGPNMRVDCEPHVPWSHGTRSVSPMTMVMESSDTPSSSAAICAREVWMPWPISIFPEKSVTRPFSSMRR
jgi:hypothetical protein